MSNVQPWTQPMRNRVSPGSRAGSAIARSFSPAFDRHGLRVEDHVRREVEREVVAVDDMDPFRKPRPKRVTSAPTPTRTSADRDCPARERSGHAAQDDRETSLRALPRSPRSALDRRTGHRRTGSHSRCFGGRRRESRDHIHPRARELLLRLLRKRREPPPEMPIGRVEDSQHDVSGFGAIRNDTWNSRVTVGARYRSS